MKQRHVILGIIIGCAIAIGVVWTVYAKWNSRTERKSLVFSNKPYSPPAVAFKGKSHDLKQSVIVPTLDTPVPAGKNIIWCAPFQMAWDHLKDDVVKEPIRIANAEIVAKRLNGSPFSESDLPDKSFYAAAGLVKDGIDQKIRQEMHERFHKEPVDLDDPGAVLVASMGTCGHRSLSQFPISRTRRTSSLRTARVVKRQSHRLEYARRTSSRIASCGHNLNRSMFS